MTSLRTVHGQSEQPVGYRFQDLARVLTEAEDRLITLAPALVAEAHERQGEDLRLAAAYKASRRAWLRHDRATAAHRAAMARHGLASDASGKSLERLLMVRHALLNELSNLAFALEPEWMTPGRPDAAGMTKVRRALETHFGKLALGLTIPGSWDRAKAGLGVQPYAEGQGAGS